MAPLHHNTPIYKPCTYTVSVHKPASGWPPSITLQLVYKVHCRCNIQGMMLRELRDQHRFLMTCLRMQGLICSTPDTFVLAVASAVAVCIYLNMKSPASMKGRCVQLPPNLTSFYDPQHQQARRAYVETSGGPPSLGVSRTSRGAVPAEVVWKLAPQAEVSVVQLLCPCRRPEYLPEQSPDADRVS